MTPEAQERHTLRHAAELSVILGAPDRVTHNLIVLAELDDPTNEKARLHIGRDGLHLEIGADRSVWSKQRVAMLYGVRNGIRVTMADDSDLISLVAYESDNDRAKAAADLLKDVAESNPTLRDAIDHLLIIMGILRPESA